MIESSLDLDGETRRGLVMGKSLGDGFVCRDREKIRYGLSGIWFGMG